MLKISSQNKHCVTNSLNRFYENKIESVIKKAAIGWIYSVSVDQYYIENKHTSKNKKIIPKLMNNRSIQREIVELNNDKFQELDDFIDTILNDKDKIRSYKKLEHFTSIINRSLLTDSFTNYPEIDFLKAQKRTFKNENKLNILIIGAGVTGLFLANIIKKNFGHKTDLLLVDNRCIKKNYRKKFDRSWLTYLNYKIISKHIDPKIRDLLGSFGTEGYIGLPLNIFETILKLSCLEQGTKFFYSPEYDFTNLYTKGINLIFDASGGKLDYKPYDILSNKMDEIYNLKIPRGINLKIQNLGINQNNSFLDEKLPNLNFTLKKELNFYYPYFNNNKIENHMMKLTKIPSKYLNQISEFLKVNNSNNMIYLWSGKLREQINEVLLIINLTDYGKSIFSSIISKNMNFKIFFDRYNNEIKKYDEELYKLLKFISFLNTDDYFIINKPFTYKPHINLLNMPHTVGGLKFYPIGDSIFSGNPKMGNGLSYHIEFINELVEEMSLSIN